MIAAGWYPQCSIDDVQQKLIATGRFSVVDVVNVETAVPLLPEPAPFDTLLTWSNADYVSGGAIGDLFADYVDQGGGVVVAVFAMSEASGNLYLDGRWETGDYFVIQSMGGNRRYCQKLWMVI